jgi:hypothetical protein
LKQLSSRKALPSWVEYRTSFVDSRLLEEARDPNTAPSRLLELCGVHPRCKELVAKNPNTPIEHLLRLWAEFPEAMLENPATDLLLLENPAAFAGAAPSILRAIFSLPNTPLFYDLVWDTVPCYRGLIASSPSLPLELALLLSKSEELAYRSALASNTALARIPEIFALLEDDLFPAVRRALAKNLALPFIYFESLSADWDSEVRENIAAHPQTPLHLLEKLSHDKIREVRLAVQKNPATPAGLKARLWYELPLKKQVKAAPLTRIIKSSGKRWLLPAKKSGPTMQTALLLDP